MKKLISIRNICLTLFLTGWISQLFAQVENQDFQQKIINWQNSAELINAAISFSVNDSKAGQLVVQSERVISLVPASIMKAVTTATALEMLGPDFRFKTSLNYSGTIRNDTLFGDLQIVGGGDPALGSRYFPEVISFQEDWIKSIKENHIRVVAGKLIVDASIYETQTIPESWVWGDLGNYYGAGASGLTVYDNMYEIHLHSPDTAYRPTKIMKTVPEIPGLELKNEVLSSDINSDQAYVFGNPEDSRRVIRGTIPKGKPDFIVKASIPNPAALLGYEFRAKLAAIGISISGATILEKATKEHTVLAETLSPPLRDIIRLTNFESVNLFAEHLLKHIAWLKTGLGATQEGCKQVVQFWKEKGLNMTGFFMSDGSGLSRFNALAASHLVFILNYMKTQSPYAPDFYQALPSAGNGTLTVFSNDIFPDETLKAKSGSMTRVRCYAGYLKTNSGKELSFAVMLNNFSCNQTTAIRKIEELLLELKKL